ncbi:MAG: leucine-rich repeat domain-containing protein, partial [Lactobacillales bacterium]|nr:leucine-rich repeat domain-containing protein [Lactobacillales bacterium]
MKNLVVKVRFALFCLILLAVILLSSKSVNAITQVGDNFEDDNHYFQTTVVKTFNNPNIGEVAISGRGQSFQRAFLNDGELEIPEYIAIDDETYKVVDIWQEAFMQDFYIQKVTIPGSVKSIGVGAFCYCPNLWKVTIGDSGASASNAERIIIGNCAFKNCEHLEIVILSEGVIRIESSAFANCFNLGQISTLGRESGSSVDLPDSLAE